MLIPHLLADAGGAAREGLGYLALANVLVWTGVFAYLVRLRMRVRDLERRWRP